MGERREHLRIGVECVPADEASARPLRRADHLAVLAGPSFNFLAPLKVWVSSEGHSRLHLAPASVVVGDAAGLAQVPERYDARRALLYASLGAFSSDVRGAAIPQGVNTAFYDPESWPQTPAEERRDPVRSMQRFAQLARQGGLTAIVAPGRDLALAQEGRCRKQPRETLDAAYLRCGFTGGARGASAFVVQAAPDELDLSALARLLRGARGQLATRSARTSVFATLSMAPPSAKEKIWPAALVRAATIELEYVDGIMLNFTPSTTWLAASFLRDLERMKKIDGIPVPG